MKTTPFDAAKFLDSEEVIAEYLAQVLAENDGDLLLTALNRALAPGAKPRFETIRRITRALGVRLSAVPA